MGNMHFKIITIIFLLFLAFWGCSQSESESSSLTQPTQASESVSSTAEESSSSAVEDTIPYAEPPTFHCEEIIAISVDPEDSSKGSWDYEYNLSGLFTNEDKLLSFDRRKSRTISRNYDEKHWKSSYITSNSYDELVGTPCKFASTLIALQKKVIYQDSKKDSSLNLCKSEDFGESWECESRKYAETNLVCEEKLVYLQEDNNLFYSSNGKDWIPFNLPEADTSRQTGYFKGNGNIQSAFMKDSLHFILMLGGILYWTHDFNNFESSYIPVYYSGTKVVYGNDVFVYAGSWNQMFYSTDLVTWKSTNRKCLSRCEPWFTDIIFENGMFVAVGSHGSSTTSNIVMNSVNGKDFLEQPTCGETGMYGFVYHDGQGKFYTFNAGGKITTYTRDE